MVPIPKALIGQSSRAGPGPQFGPEPCLVTGESLESHGRERESQDTTAKDYKFRGGV